MEARDIKVGSRVRVTFPTIKYSFDTEVLGVREFSGSVEVKNGPYAFLLVLPEWCEPIGNPEAGPSPGP